MSSASTSTRRRSTSLAEGHSLIEDIADAKLAAVLATKLDVTSNITDIKPAAAYIICVPTPLKDALPDLQYVESAGRVVGSVLEPGDLVVLESTTYPGTTEEFLAPAAREARPRAGDGLRPGLLARARSTPATRSTASRNTPKVVGGVHPSARPSGRAALRPGRRRGRAASAAPREAEMAKLLENTFRHVNIALVNELAIFCERAGHRHLGGHPARAATKPFGFHAVLARPGRRRPLHPGRPAPTCRGRCASSASVPVRRAGAGDQRPDAGYVVTRVAELLNVRGSRRVASRASSASASPTRRACRTAGSPRR